MNFLEKQVLDVFEPRFKALHDTQSAFIYLFNIEKMFAIASVSFLCIKLCPSVSGRLEKNN